MKRRGKKDEKRTSALEAVVITVVCIIVFLGIAFIKLVPYLANAEAVTEIKASEGAFGEDMEGAFGDASGETSGDASGETSGEAQDSGAV